MPRKVHHQFYQALKTAWSVYFAVCNEYKSAEVQDKQTWTREDRQKVEKMQHNASTQ